MFREDLRRTIAAWRSQPLLPVTVLAVVLVTTAASRLDGAISIVALVAAPWYLGFLGAQRLWYARAWDGRGLSPLEALRRSFAYWLEYLVLLLMGVFVGLVASVPTYFLAGRDAAALAHVAFVSVVMTFATSAVVLDDEAAGDAISTSWRLLRSGFPRCLPHALFVPWVLFAVADRSVWLVAAGEVLAFVGRGVTTSYYVRVTALPEMPSAAREPGLHV